jgi:hypothetical protein
MFYKLIIKISSLLFIFVLCLLVTSCGVVCRGLRQDVDVTSEPPDATILVDNEFYGQTPQIINISRRDNHSILLMKDGYQTEEVCLMPKCSGILAGNLGCIAIGAGAGAAAGFIMGGSDGGLLALILGGIGTVFGTLVSLGGMGVDVVSGGGYALPENVHLELQPAAR